MPAKTFALCLALAATLALTLRPAAPCPEQQDLPTSLDGLPGAPAEEQDRLTETLRPDRLQVLRYAALAQEPVTAMLLHFHGLDASEDGYTHNLYSHALDACHRLGGWEVVEDAVVQVPPADRGHGARVRRLSLSKKEPGQRLVYRLVHASYLDPGLDSSEPSMARAWIATLGRGLVGLPTGDSLLVLSTGDLPRLDPELLRLQDRRMGELLEALGAGD